MIENLILKSTMIWKIWIGGKIFQTNEQNINNIVEKKHINIISELNFAKYNYLYLKK